MIDYVSQREADELCAGLIRDYMTSSREMPMCVDIEGFLTEYLGAELVYENIREEGGNVLGFTSDGIHKLRVSRGGVKEDILFPPKTVVLDRFLIRIEESARRRFTLAHEVGHMLDERISPQPSYKREYDMEYSYDRQELRQLFAYRETHADRIGAALLLPRFLLEDALEKYNAGRRIPVYGESVFAPREKVILKKMLDALGVSYSLLTNRMRHFGLLKRHELEEYIEKELRL